MGSKSANGQPSTKRTGCRLPEPTTEVCKISKRILKVKDETGKERQARNKENNPEIKEGKRNENSRNKKIRSRRN